MLKQFFTSKIAEAALQHPVQAIRQLGRRFLLELLADGDPFAPDMVRYHQLSET